MRLRKLTAAAVSFQFARVGNDEGAANLLRKIDNDETVGQYVDCLPGIYIYTTTESHSNVAANLLVSSWH